MQLLAKSLFLSKKIYESGRGQAKKFSALLRTPPLQNSGYGPGNTSSFIGKETLVAALLGVHS